MVHEHLNPVAPQPEEEPVQPLRPESRPYGSEPSAGPASPIPVWPSGETLAGALTDGLYVAGPDGRILLANHGLARLFSAPDPDSLVGMTVQSFPTDEHLQRFPVKTGPVWVRALDGREILTHHTRIDGPDRSGGGSAGLFSQAGSDRLSALGIGVTGILHDLRNVLTGIVGNADGLAHSDDDRRDVLAGRLRDLAMFGNAIAGQLLTFAAPPSSAGRLCHINQTIRETVQAFQWRVPDTVQVEFVLDHGIAPALVDATQVGQLVMNFLLNAISALSGQVGTVTFTTSQRTVAPQLPLAARVERRPLGPYCIIEIRDTGRGMTPAEMRRVFQPFVTGTGGSGMGLAVVREILLRCGGAVEVESESGTGTTFRLFLPARD